VRARTGRPHPRAPWPRPRRRRSPARRRSTPRLARDELPRPCRPSSLGLSMQEQARLDRPEHTPELWSEAGSPSRRRVCERRVVLTAPPRRESGRRAVLVNREPGIEREAAPDASAPQREPRTPPPPKPVGRLRRRQARRAPRGGARPPSLDAAEWKAAGPQVSLGPSGHHGGPPRERGHNQ
jgi:hypothetical protein